MRDLELAALQCPDHPGIKSLRLYHTLQLQTLEDRRLQFLTEFPNESDLRLRLAIAYRNSGDIESSGRLAADAWTLNPLHAGTVCFYHQFLKLRGLNSESILKLAVESGEEARLSMGKLECP